MRVIPQPPDLKQAAETLHRLDVAIRHLRECQQASEPAVCGHVHDVGQAARAFLPLVERLALAGTLCE